MKKITIPLTIIFIMFLVSALAVRPAPDSGDGIPDGPGWTGDWANEDNSSKITGPAPNSGDGIPDGPGW